MKKNDSKNKNIVDNDSSLRVKLATKEAAMKILDNVKKEIMVARFLWRI